MTVELSPTDEEFVAKAMLTGKYASREAVVSMALSLLELDRMATLTEEELRAMTLNEVFAPIRAFDVDFPRDRSPMREVDL